MCKGNKFVLMICTSVMNLIQENILNDKRFHRRHPSTQLNDVKLSLGTEKYTRSGHTDAWNNAEVELLYTLNFSLLARQWIGR